MSTPQAVANAETEFNPFGPDSASRAESVDVVDLVRRSQKTVVFGLLCGLLLGVLVYLLLGPTYSASTRLLVSLQASFNDDNTGDRTFSDRAGHIQLLKSDKIVQAAVDRFNLGELESLQAASDPAEAISDKLQVKRSSGEDRDFQNVLELAYESPSKEDAKVVLDAIVAAYKSYLNESRDDSNTEIMGAVSGSEAELRARIDTLEEEYLKFRAETPLHWNTPVGGPAAGGGQAAPANYHMTRLNTIENDRLATETEIAGITARIDALIAMKESGESAEALEFYVLTKIAQPAAAASGEGEGGSGGAASSGAAAKAALTSEMIKAFVLRTRLMQDYGPDSETVLKADARIQAIADLYVAEGLTPPPIEAIKSGAAVDRPNLVDVYISSMRLQLQELEQRSRELDKLYDEASQAARDAAVYEVRDKRYAEELAQLTKAANMAADQRNALKMTSSRKGYTAEQITPTRVELALKRVLKVVGAFGSMGVLLTLLGLYFGEMQNTLLRDADDVSRFMQTSVLGKVPHFPAPSDAALALARQTGLDPSLRYYHGPGTADAEAFRSVRTALFHTDLRHEGRGTLIQVTSPEPGDGKSTVAANLAAAVAQSGRKVLLIDADLRRPTAHKLFGLPESRGLVDLLTGEVGWEHVTQPTGIDRLSVLTAGSRTEMPAELLSNSAVAETLRTARSEYDFVILDTPPLLAVSDPCIVAPYADGVLMVVRLNKNKRDHATHALQIVRSHGMNLLGTVINDSVAAAGSYYPEYHRNTPAPVVQRRPLPTETSADQVPQSV